MASRCFGVNPPKAMLGRPWWGIRLERIQPGNPQQNTPLGRPFLICTTDVFRPVMAKPQVLAPNHLRLAPPSDDLLGLAYHPLRRQGEVDLHPDCLAVEVIDDIEQPKRPEAHRPG